METQVSLHYPDSRKQQRQIQSYIDKLRDLGVEIEMLNIQ